MVRWIGIVLTTMLTVSSAFLAWSRLSEPGNVVYFFVPFAVLAVMLGLTLLAMRVDDHFYFQRLDRREERRAQQGSLLRRALIGPKN
jgi:hypothetical protein